MKTVAVKAGFYKNVATIYAFKLVTIFTFLILILYFEAIIDK